MAIRAIAFDLEGTIIDIESVHHRAHLAAAREFGVGISIEDAYEKLPHFIGGPDEEVAEEIRALLDEETRMKVSIEDITAMKRRSYECELEETPISVREGFFFFFSAAREMGLELSIGSLTPEKQARTLLERSGLLKHFDGRNIVLREHVENLKPAPDVFLKTAAIMGVHPSEQLVFDDSPRGVMAAIAAGSKAVGMPVILLGSTVGALVDAGANRIFFDWREMNAVELIRDLG
jgi:beta-phosphoglucomutase